MVRFWRSAAAEEAASRSGGFSPPPPLPVPLAKIRVASSKASRRARQHRRVRSAQRRQSSAAVTVKFEQAVQNAEGLLLQDAFITGQLLMSTC
jgi:hypothetical protein